MNLQVRREVAGIKSYVYPGFCLGLPDIAKHWFLIFIFIKSRAAVTGGGNSNATLAQIPVVGGHAKGNSTKIEDKS